MRTKTTTGGRRQGLTAYQMLEMYTENVAYEDTSWTDIVGTIENRQEGKTSFVIERNILDVDPKQISEGEGGPATVSNGDKSGTKEV